MVRIPTMETRKKFTFTHLTQHIHSRSLLANMNLSTVDVLMCSTITKKTS